MLSDGNYKKQQQYMHGMALISGLCFLAVVLGFLKL